MSSKPKVVDLFAGAGGLSLGLNRAGFETVCAVEFNERAAKTYAFNFPDAELKVEDVRDIDFTPYKGVDLVAGGPPCQPFSSGGKGLAQKDPRDMMPHFINSVSIMKPRAFMMENVKGLLSSRNREYLEYILKSLRELGYEVNIKMLTASD